MIASTLEQPKLNILVQSFSYKHQLPNDESGNGGGFIFDCRGILNPGRFEEYKALTGKDSSVIHFLETKTRMQEFLHAAKSLVTISIDDYLARGFEHLQINFGCTGGQHRSVYCAELMAKFLKETYPVSVTLRHIEQERKGRIL